MGYTSRDRYKPRMFRFYKDSPNRFDSTPGTKKVCRAFLVESHWNVKHEHDTRLSQSYLAIAWHERGCRVRTFYRGPNMDVCQISGVEGLTELGDPFDSLENGRA